jgi:hypothetical protein
MGMSKLVVQITKLTIARNTRFKKEITLSILKDMATLVSELRLRKAKVFMAESNQKLLYN